ncbi:MAG: hypothetical protein CBE24_02655 [bacterium TMED264]|nr:MAG: hypothetical protein CBE24_02655 [bacterium TMED264]|tara:strand:+ start:6864 stop:7187 length:324 start_codon:yes stop_codon:yes gene_type:complete
MDEYTTSSEVKTPLPEKKISSKQLEMLLGVLGDKITEEDKSNLISKGVIVSRTRNSTRRGWMLENGNKVFPSLSFKGLSGETSTEEMETFRSKYYELLEQEVPVLQN